MVTAVIIFIVLNIIVTLFGGHLLLKDVRKDLPSQSIFCALIEWFLK